MPTHQKNALLVVLVCLLPLHLLHAQKKIERPEHYQTWVYEGKADSGPGYLTYLSPDTVVLNSSIMFNNTELGSYKVSNVSQIRIRKKTSQGIGALAGLVGGGLIGWIAGSSYEGDDYCGGKCGGVQPGTVTGLMALGFALVGTATGVIIGSKKKKFYLNGRLTPEQNLQLQEYVIHMSPRQ